MQEGEPIAREDREASSATSAAASAVDDVATVWACG